MKIGFDYWNVISHYPKEFSRMAEAFNSLQAEGLEDYTGVYVISAIGDTRKDTIEQEVRELMREVNVSSDYLFKGVYEVVFDNPKQSPELKLAKCKELGIEVFFDDRKDVCDLLNKNGILAFLVPRKLGTDIGAEQK